MIPKLIGIGAAVLLASFARAAENPEIEYDRFRLACSGSMVTTGQAPPGSRIMADGIIDIPNKSVRGFGIGSAPIVSVSAEVVKFGTSALKKAAGSHGIEGTINRLSGATRVVVRSTKDPWTVLIAMELDCQPTLQAGH